jgi:hypothetical protein
MTPEGRIKAKVKRLFKNYGADLYDFWPVQSGLGEQTLDCLASHLGQFFAVETKRDGKDLTAYQKMTRDDIIAAGGVVFRVSNDDELLILREWLNQHGQLRTP